MSKKPTQEEYKTAIKVLKYSEANYRAHVKENKLEDDTIARTTGLIIPLITQYVKDLQKNER